MPKGIKPTWLKGNHNSGRKSVGEEIAKREAVIKAWNKINNEIDENPVDKVALPIALKTMVDRHDVTSADKPIPILYVSRNPSDQKDNADAAENPDSPGRNVSLQDSVNNALPDSPSPER